MKKRVVFVVAILCMLTLTACLCGCAGGQEPVEEPAGQMVYTMYVGLNDAATGEQVLTMEMASPQIRQIITDRGLGYTEFTAYGAYTEDGKVIGNDTLVYQFFFVEEENVTAIAEEAKEKLHLASILVNKSEAVYGFAGAE